MAVQAAARLASPAQVNRWQLERSRSVMAVHAAARLASPASVTSFARTRLHQCDTIWARCSRGSRIDSRRSTHRVSAAMQAPAEGARTACQASPTSANLLRLRFCLNLSGSGPDADTKIDRESSPGSVTTFTVRRRCPLVWVHRQFGLELPKTGNNGSEAVPPLESHDRSCFRFVGYGSPTSHRPHPGCCY